jgi:hypothetical protein
MLQKETRRKVVAGVEGVTIQAVPPCKKRMKEKRLDNRSIEKHSHC